MIIKRKTLAVVFKFDLLSFSEIEQGFFFFLCAHKEKETKRNAPAAAPELKNRVFF